jgi:signal transduction histidine kinase
VYFFCRDALAATGAGSTAAIRIRDDTTELRVEIECAGGGSALEAASDRIQALGGVATIRSAADATRITATVPLGQPPSER